MTGVGKGKEQKLCLLGEKGEMVISSIGLSTFNTR